MVQPLQNIDEKTTQIAFRSAQQVVFLLLPQVQLLDLAGAAQVFHTATRLGAAYELTYCGEHSEITSAQGLLLGALRPLETVTKADLVLIPGVSSENRRLHKPLLDEVARAWLRQFYSAHTPIGSICTGAFALGEAGLLDGRRCTTHWRNVDFLRQLYPTAHVVDNVLFVSDNHITTSAGIASGIDMALSLVEQDLGAIFAAKVARHMVVYLRRDGSQPQESIYLDYRTHLNQGVHDAQDFIIAHVADRITLDEIAQAAQLATRSLSRAFREATGLTPIQYQQNLRLSLARSLLSNPQINIEQVAEKCGFEDARHFRRLWKTHYGSAPSTARNA